MKKSQMSIIVRACWRESILSTNLNSIIVVTAVDMEDIWPKLLTPEMSYIAEHGMAKCAIKKMPLLKFNSWQFFTYKQPKFLL